MSRVCLAYTLRLGDLRDVDLVCLLTVIGRKARRYIRGVVGPTYRDVNAVVELDLMLELLDDLPGRQMLCGFSIYKGPAVSPFQSEEDGGIALCEGRLLALAHASTFQS